MTVTFADAPSRCAGSTTLALSRCAGPTTLALAAALVDEGDEFDEGDGLPDGHGPDPGERADDIWEVDTSDMVVVHRALRRETGLLPGLVRAVRPGDRGRAQLIGAHVIEVLDGLRRHHEGEDALVWPVLRRRAVLDRAIVDRMIAQHTRIASLTHEVTHLVAAWLPRADGATRDLLADRTGRLAAALGQHLDEEEAEVLAVVARTFTIGEWAAVGQRGMAEIPRGQRLRVLGALLEDATASECRQVLGRLPLAARLAWRLVGRRAYAARVRAVRDDAPRRVSGKERATPVTLPVTSG